MRAYWINSLFTSILFFTSFRTDGRTDRHTDRYSLLAMRWRIYKGLIWTHLTMTASASLCPCPPAYVLIPAYFLLLVFVQEKFFAYRLPRPRENQWRDYIHTNFACSLVATTRIYLSEDIYEFSFWIQENTPKVDNCHILEVGGFAGQKTKFKILFR